MSFFAQFCGVCACVIFGALALLALGYVTKAVLGYLDDIGDSLDTLKYKYNKYKKEKEQQR